MLTDNRETAFSKCLFELRNEQFWSLIEVTFSKAAKDTMKYKDLVNKRHENIAMSAICQTRSIR